MSPRYAMAVDLERCVGCQTCTAACKHANDTLPGVQWRHVLDVEAGRYPDVQRLFLVVGCQHCAEPPCVPVCPSGATFQRADGLVAMDYERCIGCGYCAVACPYQARTIAHEQRWYFGERTRQEEAVRRPERLGVAQKCSFCVERIDEAERLALVPGRDLEVTPACAASCIAQAIHFGDAEDPDSPLSQALRGRKSFQMHAGLGTDPQIRYLYDPPSDPGGGANGTHEAGETSGTPVEAEPAPAPLAGERQRFWDSRAASNFVFGGIGSGLVIAAWLVERFAPLPGRDPGAFRLAALGLIALGLGAVFFEIGRKRRFLLVLRRPRSSWMTREVYAVAALFAGAGAALLVPHAGLDALAALTAAAFLYCQARILHAARGIPAWRTGWMPAMLIGAGLHDGVAVIALAAGFLGHDAAAGLVVAAAGTVLAAVNAALWRGYRGWARGVGCPPAARRVIERASGWVHTGAHVVPALLFLVVLSGPAGAAAVLLPLAGACVIAANAGWRWSVIVHAGYQQGFALPVLPRRGSGSRAAPRRLPAGP